MDIYKLRKITLVTLGTLILLLLAGYTYQTVSLKNASDSIKPPGKLFTVNDYKIHLHCTGSGSPTVILEASEGGLASSWGWIQPEVTKKTRVCSYDRRGRGWSTGDSKELSIEQAAKDLHAVLWAAQLQDKYIFVGHGLGGIYAQKYQERYPDEVVGLVLIDASNPAQVVTTPDMLKSANTLENEYRLLASVSQIGITRLYFSAGGKNFFHTLPEKDIAESEYFWTVPEHYTSMANEYAQIETLYAQGEEFGSVDPIPVRIISAAETTPEWERLQNDLFTLSKDSTRVTIPDSTHLSLVYTKEHAQRVIPVINSLVQTVKEE